MNAYKREIEELLTATLHQPFDSEGVAPPAQTSYYRLPKGLNPSTFVVARECNVSHKIGGLELIFFVRDID